MNYLILFIVFISLMLLYSINGIQYNNDIYKVNYGIHRAQPTKCFDCENELPSDYKYLGGPTKCFSCERQFMRI